MQIRAFILMRRGLQRWRLAAALPVALAPANDGSLWVGTASGNPLRSHGSRF